LARFNLTNERITDKPARKSAGVMRVRRITPQAIKRRNSA
jgi:hypothetical protein